MSTLRVLYQSARADFLERTRRYGFLITIGLTIYVAYLYIPPASSGYLGFSLGGVRGVYNSAWIGGIITLLCVTLLVLPGFYLVKNSITRDIDTRVGEIIATTPISKWSYAFGKMLSNLAYLCAMTAVIAGAGIVMQLIRAEDTHINLWGYLGPLLLSALPMMMLVSALALLFESIPVLRGGFGNILYAFLWLTSLIISIMLSDPSVVQADMTGSMHANADPMGMTAIVADMQDTGRQTYPEIQSGFVIGGSPVQGALRTFVWNGTAWTMQAISGRLLWIAVALGIAALAAVFFNRFDPSTEHGRREKARVPEKDEQAVIPAPATRRRETHLTPLQARSGSALSLFVRTWLAELLLIFKGVRWWWYLVTLGILIATLTAPLNIVRHYLLLAAWVWPILLWSPLGNRAIRARTQQLTFSAPYPLQRQLPAMWLAGFTLAVLSSAGYAIRVLGTGQLPVLFAWLVGAAFIPSLALALGAWSRSSKLFEVVYILLWYVGPMNGMAALDYMGTTDAAIALGTPLYFLAASLVLMVLAFAGWKRMA